jgi:hypothetical protein
VVGCTASIGPGAWCTTYAITPAGLRAIGVEPDEYAEVPEPAPEDEEEPIPPYDSEEERAMQRAEAVERESAAADATEPEARAVADTAPTGAEDAADAATPAAEATARPTATTAPTRGNLRAAAQAVLDAWDDEENQRYGLVDAIDALRAALVGPTRAHREPRKPRAGTKQDAVLALLRRPEGATIAQIIDVTGWQSHTVRGFFAGLKRKGITVEAIERVRMVGPNREGAKGSFSVYRLAAAAE